MARRIWNRHDWLETEWWAVDALEEALTLEGGISPEWRIRAEAERIVASEGVEGALLRVAETEALTGRRIPCTKGDGP